MTEKGKIYLSFDVEEFDLPEEYGYGTVPDGEKFDLSAAGMNAALDVIEAEGIRATYFITSDFAERFPDMIRRMTETGGEIASHGVSHSSFKKEDLAQSKSVLERLSGRSVSSFRMARLAPVDKKDILDAGFRCESSLNPVWLPGRYNHFSASLLPFDESCGLRQYPVSAVPLVRFPLFWLSFKTLPGGLYRRLAVHTLRRTGYFNLYTHPWEYNAASRDPKWKIPGYITRHAGPAQAERLARLIDALRPHGEFRTFQDDAEA